MNNRQLDRMILEDLRRDSETSLAQEIMRRNAYNFLKSPEHHWDTIGNPFNIGGSGSTSVKKQVGYWGNKGTSSPKKQIGYWGGKK